MILLQISLIVELHINLAIVICINTMTADCHALKTNQHCTLDLRVYEDDSAHAGVCVCSVTVIYNNNKRVN